MSVPMQIGKSCGYAIIVFLMSKLSAAWAQGADPSPTFLNALEFRIEIGRHERLAKRRNAEDAVLSPFRSDGCSGGLSTGWAFISTTLPAMAIARPGRIAASRMIEPTTRAGRPTPMPGPVSKRAALPTKDCVCAS
jgi:hypothetical protein